jgi:cobalt/nickel transport system permease protein
MILLLPSLACWSIDYLGLNFNMPDITNTLYNLRMLDDLATKESAIHRLHPLVKLLTTIVFLVVVISFERFEILALLPFFFYPVITLTLAELPAVPILKRILLAAPFVLGIGILNPLFDQQTVTFLGINISRGWLTFLSLTIKTGLTVTAALLLIATTGMDRLAATLRMLKIPKLFVMQVLLTYRYITVLLEETARILRAYSLRAPNQKGVRRNAWGSLAGQLLLRTFDRAQRVYQAMCLRGFTGEYHTGVNFKFTGRDFLYLTGWCIFFIVARMFNIPNLLGMLFTGVIHR